MEFESLWEKRTSPNYGYRPVLPHEKRMWEIQYKPKMYEYGGFDRTQAVQEKPVAVNITADGILMLAILELLKSLSNPEESDIQGQERETPQS
jgi:hypothetical protein